MMVRIFALFLVAVLVGCGGGDAPKNDEKSKAPAEPVRVRLGFFPNVTHAQALIGVERGDFQKALGDDVKLETAVFNAGPSVIEAIFAGELDVSYVGPSPVINGFMRSKGDALRVVAGSAENGIVIVGNKKRGITTLEQLKGGRIATPQLGNTQDISARYYVMNTFKTPIGNKTGETQIIPTANPDIENLFLKDQLDGAWIPEPWASRLVANDLVVVIAEEKDLWESKRFSLTTIIARRKFLEEHPDVVKKILTAHVKITAELQADRAALAPVINASMKRLTTKTLPDKVLLDSLARCEFNTDPLEDTIREFQRKGGALKLLPQGEFDFPKLVDRRLLDEILKAQPATP